jgi:hypothetical protein
MTRPLLSALTLVSICLGCASGIRPSATPVPTNTTKASEPPAPTSTPKSQEPVAALVVAPVPEYCERFLLTPTTTGTELPAGACLATLDTALGGESAELQSRALAGIEDCPLFPPGLIRALRAELAPEECADALTSPLLTNPKPGQTQAITDVLSGLSVGARLARTSTEVPSVEASVDRASFQALLREHLTPWFTAQAHTIHTLATEGARLSGYGKAIAAVQSGLADLRFVESVRAIALPKEMATDPEMVQVYEQALEDALEPRKTRGRDAILVALRLFSELGVIHDKRLEAARNKVEKLYAGSRIDALEALLLPPLAPTQNTTVEQRLAARLPTFYSEYLLPMTAALDPLVLQALLERGLPPKVRDTLAKSPFGPNVATVYARGLVELGALYFTPASFDKAAALGTAGASASATEQAEAELLLAVAEALRGGPPNTVVLMLRGPLLPEGMGNVTKLDQLGARRSPTAGFALFNAAHILSILPQKSPSPAYWTDIASRFERATKLLTDPQHQRIAKARAEDARATAEAVREAKGQQN